MPAQTIRIQILMLLKGRICIEGDTEVTVDQMVAYLRQVRSLSGRCNAKGGRLQSEIFVRFITKKLWQKELKQKLHLYRR